MPRQPLRVTLIAWLSRIRLIQPSSSQMRHARCPSARRDLVAARSSLDKECRMGVWSAHLRDGRAETGKPRASFLGRLAGLVAEHQKAARHQCVRYPDASAERVITG